MTSVEPDAQHVRMETAATLVNEKGDYFDHEPNISPSSSERKEEPVLVLPMSPTVNDGVATSNTIPPNHPYRTLVVCFDGTGDQFDEDNSNIVEFVGLLKNDDPSKQMVYYQSGIGTYTSPQYSSSYIASNFSQLMDKAFAWNLEAHVTGGYEFLMQNYRPTDKICIFGFSRGSYTAQCLAGMLHKVGLLPAFNNQQIPFAYKMYKAADRAGFTQSPQFKQKFGIKVKIEFVGLWDTVNSVGLTPRRMPFTRTNKAIKTFRHAVALDEHRAKFRPVHWHAPNCHQSHPKVVKTTQGEFALTIFEEMFADDSEEEEGGEEKGTDVDEVWFAGCHCDIGGGSVKNSVTTSLARIPLRWMIRECFKTGSGILFRADRLKTVHLDPKTLYPEVSVRPEARPLTALPAEERYIQPMKAHERVTKPSAFAWFLGLFKKAPMMKDLESESDEDVDNKSPVIAEELADLKDSLAPIYDQLKLNRWWIIPEYIPFKQRYQEVDKKLQLCPEVRKRNKGKGRKFPTYTGKENDPVRVHRSVKTRMEASYLSGKKYSPKVVNFKEKSIVWVD